MLFPKQKVLIGLLLVSVPVTGFLALVENSAVSGIALKVALRLARFRTGLRLETQRWTVDPLSFSATLQDVMVGVDSINVRAPSVSVQLSPLSLALGRFHLREIELDAPFISGTIPPAWLEDDGPSTFDKNDIPSSVGLKVAEIVDKIREKRLSFDRVRVRNLKLQVRDYGVRDATFELSNLDGGQLRFDWSVAGLELPGKFSRVARIDGSVALLRERRRQFFIAFRDFKADLEDESETPQAVFGVQAEGRWPGEFRVKASTDVERLIAWMKKSPLIQGKTPEFKSAGRLELKGEGQLKRARLDSLGGSIVAHAVSARGYRSNKLEGAFRWNGAGFDVSNVRLELPKTVYAETQTKHGGFLEISQLRVADGKISGTLTAIDADLCSVLVATDVPDCYSSIALKGTVPFEGTLNPFLVRARPNLTGGVAHIQNEPFNAKNVHDPFLTLQPPRMTGLVEIGPKRLDLKGVDLVWPGDDSTVKVTGHVVYDPVFADLDVTGSGAKFESMFGHFMNLRVQGASKIEAKVVYNEEVAQDRGRTKVYAQLNVDGFGIEDQTLGVLTGPIEYSRNELRLGPLKLANGGGKAVVNGWLRAKDGASKMRLLATLDRLEVAAKLPGGDKPFFRGFASGTANLDGFTDFNRFPGAAFGGPIHLDIDTLQAFGIPYQSAVVDAIYRDKILDIRRFRARKGEGFVELAGILHPVSGTELKFTSSDIAIKKLGWDASLDVFQDGYFRLKEGFWAPAKGWRVSGDLTQLKIAGRTLPAGSLDLSGDGTFMNLDLKVGKDLLFSTVQKDSNYVSWKASVKDSAFYTAFAWLKRWTGEVPITSEGTLSVDWTPSRGKVVVEDVSISGPEGSDARIVPLLKVPGRHELAWADGKLTGNTFTLDGPTRFAVTGNNGDASVGLQGELPAALLDFVVPALRFREGRISFAGRMPLAPDISTLNLTYRAKELGLWIPGIGQPVTRLSGDGDFHDGRLGFGALSGQLGTGDVALSGTYRLDRPMSGMFLDVKLNRAQAIILDDILMDATGEISIKGEHPPYLTNGSLSIANGLYSKEFGDKTTPSVATADNAVPFLRFGLDVELGSNCRVRNSVISSLVTGRMALAGTEQNPELQGSLDLSNGSIFAKDSEFKISQGRVVFPGGATKIPVVNLLATATIKQTSQDYRIQLQARGPGDALSVDLSSDPTLPQQDIVNLLAFGVLRPQTEAQSSGNLGAAQVEALNMVFGKILSPNISKATGFQVRFESGLDSNQARSIPRVTAVKKISDKVTLTLGSSIEQSSPEASAKVDYSLLKNVSLSGVYEKRSSVQDTGVTKNQDSKGVDLRFRFDLK